MTTYLIFIVWALLGLYFLAFFVLRRPRRALNLVWALACTGWPAMAAREHRWFGGLKATAVVAAGVVIGALGLAIVGAFEVQQRKSLLLSLSQRAALFLRGLLE